MDKIRQAHFGTAVQLIERYTGDLPLRHYLQHYFSQHKKHGSKDRKEISQLCYAYFRLGHAFKEKTVEERLQLAVSAPSVLFPWKEELSKELDAAAFEQSFLQQPDLFIRIRPGKETGVLKKLVDNDLTYRQISATCLALPNTTKIDSILELDKEAVIQDYSSQRVGELFPSNIADPVLKSSSLWDCCAASGGKSIMAYDLLPGVALTVSDIRPSILHNLKERFIRAGIVQYTSFVADLASARTQIPEGQYDLIIADVPCSGSGTWARTPEQLYFFEKERIAQYAALQRTIVTRVIPYLKPGATLLYITCSVFKQENEETAEFIQNEFRMHMREMKLIKGYVDKADSMFVAAFNCD